MIKKLLTILCLSTVLCSSAITITVTNTADSGPGTLRDAVVSSSPGDVIDFNVTGTITLLSNITISKGITILGPGVSALTIDGNNTNRIFKITAGTVIINDLTLSHGNTSGKGGGINISGSASVTVNRCVLSSCSAGLDGGGIIVESGNLHLNYCTFDSNHATYDGGGIIVNGGTVIISGCTFSNNDSGFSGAAIRRVGGSVTVINTTLSGNHAHMYGGGFQGAITLRNCTITNNRADDAGGGAESENATFVNCIIYGNTCGNGPDIHNHFISKGVNIIGSTSGNSGASGADIIGTNPQLGPLSMNGGITKTHAIPLTSVAINAGSNCCGTPSNDQRDSIRGCKPDIGAFENTDANTTIQSIDTHVACGSYTWIDGNLYTTNNSTATVTLTSVEGCDSVVTLHLTINQPSTGDTTATACSSFDWYGTNYTSSGTHTHTLTNAAGCDSVVTLHLTINQPSTGDTTATACSSFDWYGTNYTSSGTHTHTLTNAVGCDSVVTLHLTINQPSTGDTTATACSSFDWYGTNYTSSGTHTHTLTNAVGCDSVVTLHLTINQPSTGDTTATACSSFDWYGTNYTASGTHTHTLSTSAGCDSVVTLHLTINQPSGSDTTVTACGSYEWFGTTYTSSGNRSFTFTNSGGCDSIVTLHLTIHSFPDVATTQTDGIHLSANSIGVTYQWINCGNGNASITGETNKYFTPTANGNYAVIVDNGNCVDTSACISVSTVGLKGLNQNIGIKIFPNPTKNKVTVQSDMNIKSIDIYNLVGKKVLTIHPETDKTQIDLTHLTPAIYLMKIQTKDGETSTVKLMKR